jgi:hypothetical protein
MIVTSRAEVVRQLFTKVEGGGVDWSEEIERRFLLGEGG